MVKDHKYFEVLEKYTLAFNIQIASFILIFCRYLLHIHYAPDTVLGTGCSVRGENHLYVCEQCTLSRGKRQFNNQTNVQFKMVINTMNKHRRFFEKAKQRRLIEIGSRLENTSLTTSLQLKSNGTVELDKLRVGQSIAHAEVIAHAKALSTNGAWYVGS